MIFRALLVLLLTAGPAMACAVGTPVGPSMVQESQYLVVAEISEAVEVDVGGRPVAESGAPRLGLAIAFRPVEVIRGDDRPVWRGLLRGAGPDDLARIAPPGEGPWLVGLEPTMEGVMKGLVWPAGQDAQPVPDGHGGVLLEVFDRICQAGIAIQPWNDDMKTLVQSWRETHK